MSASFLGSNVLIKLQNGSQLVGKIVAIDADRGSLSIRQASGAVKEINRNIIQDLQLQPSTISKSSPQQNGQGNIPYDPAVVSYVTQEKEIAHSQTSIPSSSSFSVEQEPHSRSRKVKTKEDKGTKSSRRGTPDIANESKSGAPAKGRKQRLGTNKNGAKNSDLDEDFDFDKALKSFDKKKIWEEIKSTDRTDPTTLLVSHNRLEDERKSSSRGAQDKLAWNEPVLSPPAYPADQSVPGLVHRSESDEPLEMYGLQEELEKLRTQSLQHQIEMSVLREEVGRLRNQSLLYETLAGLDIKSPHESSSRKWAVSIYVSSKIRNESKARAKYGNPLTTGTLTFFLSIEAGELQEGTIHKLRYLGPDPALSDPNVIERLPAQYKNEMGLKAETAAVFIGRLKDAIQASSSN